MDIPALLAAVGANLLSIALVSLAAGVTAPRWPRRWLERDRGPLRLTGFDDLHRFRRWGVHRWAVRLPEAGAAFGGANKRLHPRTTAAERLAYAVELRRAEWVHWLGLFAVVPVLARGPWWLGGAFALGVTAVNLAFIAILRNNRLRVYSLLERERRRD